MRRTSIIMGMPISLDIPECHEERIFELAFRKILEVDKQFSPYRAKSELAGYQRGEIAYEDLSTKMRQLMKACERAERDTGGYFSAYFSGHFDPTGYVKGWAISEAGKMLKLAGQRTFCLNVGGDILASSDGEKIWRVGILDPTNPKNLTSQVSLKNGAIATSGNYERGRHILNPKTMEAADYWASVSVVGQDILQADILATAIFAAGPKGLDLQAKYPAYQILAIPREVVGDDLATRYAQVH